MPLAPAVTHTLSRDWIVRSEHPTVTIRLYPDPCTKRVGDARLPPGPQRRHPPHRQEGHPAPGMARRRLTGRTNALRPSPARPEPHSVHLSCTSTELVTSAHNTGGRGGAHAQSSSPAPGPADGEPSTMSRTFSVAQIPGDRRPDQMPGLLDQSAGGASPWRGREADDQGSRPAHETQPRLEGHWIPVSASTVSAAALHRE